MMRPAEIFEPLAASRGYAFHTGEDHTAGGVVRVYPAAWMSPAAVVGHSGRREGETTFRVALHLMTLTGDRETLEADALAIAAAAAQSPRVSSVSNVKAQPAAQSLTAHGEISVTLTLDAALWYYN